METVNKLASAVGSKLPSGQQDKPRSMNVFTGEVLQEFSCISDQEVNSKIEESWKAFQKYRKTSVSERASRFRKLADILEKQTDRFAKIITMEMGKPIKESREEVRMCLQECRLLADHTDEYTKPQHIEREAKKSYVRYDPMGVILHITPYNFPLRSLFRGTLSALLMGNTVINKNAYNCPQVGITAEEAFREAGWSNGEFLNLLVGNEQCELFIKHPYVRLVSFIGSTEGGTKVAELAGKYCKKSILELGGSDPFIVLKDADLEKAVDQGVKGRLMDGGQVSTAAKRFIIDEKVYDQFKDKLIQRLSNVKMGDPMDESTTLGPLAKKSGFEQCKDQCERAKKSGSKLLYGGEQPKDQKLADKGFFMPTVFEVNEQSPLFQEETFGPIFALIKFNNETEAIRMANNTRFGQGSAIFSKDEERAEKLAAEIEAGSVYINHYMNWNCGMPEGGFKDSGYGRDGGRHGCHEFANIKTVWIGK